LHTTQRANTSASTIQKKEARIKQLNQTKQKQNKQQKTQKKKRKRTREALGD
jgi:hypothetical protein